ncbi:exported hypothetical protein [metagenome]|uniref:Uncharacterized protein n=1 Tax=metagenome TaxID=256318 RepID=A0A2P2C054_9ZZZZ
MVTVIAAVLGAWLLLSVVVSLGLAQVMGLSKTGAPALSTLLAADDVRHRQRVPA